MHGTNLLWRAISVIASIASLVAPACAAKTQAPSRANVRSKVVAKVGGPAYLVRKGDTLSHIAKRLHVSVRELARVNNLRDPNRIRAGQALRLPGSQANHKQASPGDQQNDRFVRTALQYRGVPYRYAGMSSRGMDCSGLVARVLKSHGIKAPHNAASLYRLGIPVAYAKLRPGDLVFFHTTRRGISHVGVYVGEGKFVHASSHGGRVQVDRMDQGYYRQRFVGARRIQ